MADANAMFILQLLVSCYFAWLAGKYKAQLENHMDQCGNAIKNSVDEAQ